MVQIAQADLDGKLDDIGPLHFLRVEWWDGSPRFVLLRYSLNNRVEPLGLRLDLDKKAILDSVRNSYLDDGIRQRLETIWAVVVRERAKVIAGVH
jgi:hypothetical protein